jgi:hypothetical protein
MNVDFNHMREVIGRDYNKLTALLTRSHGQDADAGTPVIVDATQLQDHLDEIGRHIATLLSLYDPNGSFDSVDFNLEHFYADPTERP